MLDSRAQVHARARAHSCRRCDARDRKNFMSSYLIRRLQKEREGGVGLSWAEYRTIPRIRTRAMRVNPTFERVHFNAGARDR